MKIKIDTDNKVIELESDTKIVDLIEFLRDTIKDWREYKITAMRFEHVPYYPALPYIPTSVPPNPYPWDGPWVTEPYTYSGTGFYPENTEDN